MIAHTIAESLPDTSIRVVYTHPPEPATSNTPSVDLMKRRCCEIHTFYAMCCCFARKVYFGSPEDRELDVICNYVFHPSGTHYLGKINQDVEWDSKIDDEAYDPAIRYCFPCFFIHINCWVLCWDMLGWKC